MDNGQWMGIALKETSETEYWLMLLRRTDYVDAAQFQSLHRDIIELLKLLTSVIKTAKQSPSRNG
jgi:four helix bundle protein